MRGPGRSGSKSVDSRSALAVAEKISELFYRLKRFSRYFRSDTCIEAPSREPEGRRAESGRRAGRRGHHYGRTRVSPSTTMTPSWVALTVTCMVKKRACRARLAPRAAPEGVGELSCRAPSASGGRGWLPPPALERRRLPLRRRRIPVRAPQGTVALIAKSNGLRLANLAALCRERRTGSQPVSVRLAVALHAVAMLA